MTESEAIKEINHEVCGEKGKSKLCHDKCMYGKEKCAYSMAIESLEEIQQYRVIGTAEEIQEKIEMLQRWHDEHREDITIDLPEYRGLCNVDEVEHLKRLKTIIQRNGTIGKALDECAEYEKIGTVEECREARERQRTKKVKNRKLLRDFYGRPYSVRGDCPNCGSIGLLSTDTDYCNACGQKLDWSDPN